MAIDADVGESLIKEFLGTERFMDAARVRRVVTLYNLYTALTNDVDGASRLTIAHLVNGD